MTDTTFAKLAPDAPYYFFEPQNTDCRSEYDGGWKINEIMPVNSAGFITARDHFVVDFDRNALLSRIADFANQNLKDETVRQKYFAGCGSDKYPDGDTRGWKLPAARKRVQADKTWRSRVRSCCYRPFDQRVIYWADWMVDWPRPEVMGQMLAGPNIAFHVCRQSVSEQWCHVLVANGLADDCYVSNKTRERGYTHPLFIYPKSGELAHKDGPEPNFSVTFLTALAKAIGGNSATQGVIPIGVSAEDIFHYIYAVLHCPTYRSRYAEFLKIDFPRVPLPGSLELFHELARLGRELVGLHLLESPALDRPLTKFVGAATSVVEKVSFANQTVWLDKAQSSGFRGVSEAVWNFHIGGYQVCQKWLKDRKGRPLSADDIAHYHKIVVALTNTIRLMSEIDEVINQHGGWPDAFASASPPPDSSQTSAAE